MDANEFLFLPDPIREGLIVACIAVIVCGAVKQLYAFVKDRAK